MSSSSVPSRLTCASSTSSTSHLYNNVLWRRQPWTAAKCDWLGFQLGGTRYALYFRHRPNIRIDAISLPSNLLIISTVTVILRLVSHVIIARSKNIDDGFITLAMVRRLRSKLDDGISALTAWRFWSSSTLLELYLSPSMYRTDMENISRLSHTVKLSASVAWPRLYKPSAFGPLLCQNSPWWLCLYSSSLHPGAPPSFSTHRPVFCLSSLSFLPS